MYMYRPLQVHYVVVLPADQLYRADLAQLVSYHIREYNCVTIAVHGMPAEDVEVLGVVKVGPMYLPTRSAHR